MGYNASGLWTPDNPDGSQTGSGPAGGGLLNPNGSSPGASTGMPTSATPTGTTGNGKSSSVIDNVNADLAGNSTYVQAAKSAGADYANQRGVTNSSIGAGAAEGAAINAVTPIATADASNTTQKDLSAQGYAQSTQLQGQQIAGQTAIAQMNIDAAAKQQAAQIVAQLQISGDQIAAQRDIANLQISDADKQQLLSIAEQTNLANIQQQTQLTVANMNVASDQQDKAMAAATTYASIYQNMVNSINGNTQIPADARQAYLQNAKTLYDNGMGLVEQTYNVKLDWGNQPTAAGGSGGYAAPQAAPQTQQELTTQNAQTAANYSQGGGSGGSPQQIIASGGIPQGWFGAGNGNYTDGTNLYDGAGNWIGSAANAS